MEGGCTVMLHESISRYPSSKILAYFVSNFKVINQLLYLPMVIFELKVTLSSFLFTDHLEIAYLYFLTLFQDCEENVIFGNKTSHVVLT